MASKFLSLEQLRQATKRTRDDLAKLRSLNSALQGKVASLSNKQYRDSFVIEETAKAREQAKEEVYKYLEQQGTYARLALIKQQKDAWSVRAFLARQPGVPDPAFKEYDTDGNQRKAWESILAHMKLHSSLLAVSMMDTESLEQAADTALEEQDWPRLGACLNRLGQKAEQGSDGVSDDARRARNRFDQVEIGPVKEANDLIAEGAQLEEFIGYALRSIASGESDLGERIQSYDTQLNEQEAAKVKATLANETARQSYEVRNRLAS